MGRKHRSPEGRAKIALEALCEDKPLHEIAYAYGVHPTQISEWKRTLLDGAADAFRRGRGSREKELEAEREKLVKQIGEAQVENNFLKRFFSDFVGRLSKAG